MKLGIQYPLQCPPGTDEAQVVYDTLKLAEHADARGYDLFCTIEHPFFPGLSINTNPLALFCTLAERTSKLRRERIECFRPVQGYAADTGVVLG